ncbi:MAG: hypothetical protein DHS20C15_19690 [Planctomycetota bacterium]|nr:MAG: hypothetical protein DHS20C15_19690 [Planctomycetota bacterium]
MSPRRAVQLALFLFTFCIASPASRAELTFNALNPDEGTLGTLVELRLVGDIGKGKPKVWLTRSDDSSNKPKKTKTKVFSAVDIGGDVSSLLVQVKKSKTGPGLYDLHVKPKGKGLSVQTFEKVFTMEAPVLAAVDPSTTVSKAKVTLSGTHFGLPKKPVVRATPVGGGKSKKVKVLEVMNDGMALVKLPKLAPGTYDLSLANKVGESVLAAGLTISGAGGPGPGNFTDFVRATLSSSEQALLTTQFNAEGPGKPFHSVLGLNISSQFADQMTINAGMNVGVDAVSLAMTLPFNPGVTPTPFTIDFSAPTVFGIGFTQTSPHASWDSSDTMSGSVTIESATAERVEGSFEFSLGPAAASPSPAAGELHLTGGSFSVPVMRL